MILTDPKIEQQHREFARQMLLAYSLLAILLLPVYQLLDLMWIDGLSPLWWSNAGWRGLPFIAAFVGLWWAIKHREGDGAPLILRLMTISLMTMMLGLFISNYLSADGNVALMINGFIIITFAVSLACLRGARELMLVCGVPLITLFVVLGWLSQSILEVAYSLFNVVSAFIIALIISELLARTRLHLFIQQAELRKSAATDPLTGMNNRRYIEPQLRSEISRAQRHGTSFAVVIADLDRFKRVNDQYGHNVGDAVLKILAKRILDTIRDEDRAVRWGGEEFLVLMLESDVDQAYIAAERIRKAVGDTPFEIDDLRLPITLSLGVAEYAGEDEPTSLIARADQALYNAKDTGRNRVCIDQSTPKKEL